MLVPISTPSHYSVGKYTCNLIHTSKIIPYKSQSHPSPKKKMFFVISASFKDNPVYFI